MLGLGQCGNDYCVKGLAQRTRSSRSQRHHKSEPGSDGCERSRGYPLIIYQTRRCITAHNPGDDRGQVGAARFPFINVPQSFLLPSSPILEPPAVCTMTNSGVDSHGFFFGGTCCM